MPEIKTSAQLVYVAAPYSDLDPAVIAGRMAVFDATIASLLTEGRNFPISPLMNHIIVGKHAIPGNWEFWQHYSRRLLARCDELCIITLPGWEESVGVQGEIEFARSLSLPISYTHGSLEIYHAAMEEYRLGQLAPQV